jgi:hypothetical protein
MKTLNPYQQLIESLTDDGLLTPAKKLNCLLCEMTWATGSEFLGAFGSEMENIKQSYWNRMSETTQSSFAASARIVLKTWPKMKL